MIEVACVLASMVLITGLSILMEHALSGPPRPPLTSAESLVLDRLIASGLTRKRAHQELLVRRALLAGLSK